MSVSNAYRTIKAMDNKELAIYVAAAAGSLWLLSKLLRAIAHYVLPKQVSPFGDGAFN
jgi:hypothetical protein